MQNIYNQFLRSIKSTHDFIEAESYITLYLNAKSGIEKNAAEIAIIVSYSRPFSGNKETIKGIPNSLPNKILKTLNEHERELHDKIVKVFRNKLVAHSELSYIQPNTKVSQNGALTETEKLYNNCLLENIDLQALSVLISKLKRATNEHSSELRNKLPDGIYKLNHT